MVSGANKRFDMRPAGLERSATVTEPTDNSDTAALMAQRYGVASRSRRGAAIVAIALGAVIGLAWVIWAAWHQATNSVSGEVSAFDVAGPHRIDASVDIHRPMHASVRCTVQAEATDHTVVGEIVVSPPPSGDSDVHLEVTIKTDREATTALVSECH
jgi:uncharacterized protein DUF4307